jgi:hypothetical protein
MAISWEIICLEFIKLPILGDKLSRKLQTTAYKSIFRVLNNRTQQEINKVYVV